MKDVIKYIRNLENQAGKDQALSNKSSNKILR